MNLNSTKHSNGDPPMLVTRQQQGMSLDNVASDDFLRAIVEVCVSSVAVLDESGNVLCASKAWSVLESMHDPMETNNRALHYFKSCRRFTETEFDEDASLTLADDIQQVLLGYQKDFQRRYYCSLKSGKSPFVMHAARLNLPGSAFRVLMTHEVPLNIGDEFRNNKERLIELLGTTKILAWEGNVEGQRFNYVSEQATKMLGYPLATWYEPDFLAAHLHPDDRDWVLAAYKRQTSLTKHFDLTFRMIANDGRVVWMHNLISVAPDDSNSVHGFLIDISERRRVEEAQKDLGARLISAQEEERRRVARELHDDFNQRLAVLSIELEQLGERIQKPLNVRHQVQLLKAQVQEISAEIHRLSYRLHPSKLDHLGLAAAVKSLCKEISASGKVEVDFHQMGFPAPLQEDITLCVFRITQEALRNCVKHSGADSARVVLSKTSSSVRLTVSDNGRGFDTKSDAMEKGLGFISMKERLHIVGGQLNVTSAPLRGTRIEVVVPLSGNAKPPIH